MGEYIPFQGAALHEAVQVVEKEVKAWISSAWAEDDHGFEALTQRLLELLHKHGSRQVSGDI